MVEEYRRVVKVIDEQNILLHGYCLRKNKLLENVLRNFLKINSEEQIHEELARLGLRVKNLHRMWSTSKTFALVVIQLEQSSELERIFNFKTLLVVFVQGSLE